MKQERLDDWLLKLIRNDDKQGTIHSWLEEQRFIFLPLFAKSISHLINGGSIILATDDKRAWFAEYINTNINTLSSQRPFIPIAKSHILEETIGKHSNANHFSLVHKILDRSHTNYQFWYIGTHTMKLDFILSSKHSGLYWILDSKQNNTFNFNSNDTQLDFKLITAFKIYDLMLSAAMLDEVSLDLE